MRKSYPEKFIAELLKQLNIQFTKEKIFPWSRNIAHINLKLSGNKRYDFYFKFNSFEETQQVYNELLEGAKILSDIKESLSRKEYSNCI